MIFNLISLAFDIMIVPKFILDFMNFLRIKLQVRNFGGKPAEAFPKAGGGWATGHDPSIAGKML